MRYCFPQCESLYHTGFYWDPYQLDDLKSYNILWTVNQWYPNVANIDNLNMTWMGETARFFWDLTIKPRYCYKGRYCWSCHEPKWPGYEPVNRPVNDKWINLNS